MIHARYFPDINDQQVVDYKFITSIENEINRRASLGLRLDFVKKLTNAEASYLKLYGFYLEPLLDGVCDIYIVKAIK